MADAKVGPRQNNLRKSYNERKLIDSNLHVRVQMVNKFTFIFYLIKRFIHLQSMWPSGFSTTAKTVRHRSTGSGSSIESPVVDRLWLPLEEMVNESPWEHALAPGVPSMRKEEHIMQKIQMMHGLSMQPPLLEP